MSTAETELEKELITTEELAKMLSVSKKFIESHRNSIIGAMKIGRVWRFNIKQIRSNLASGKSVIISNKRK